jgi:uncharacterized protein YerC
MELLLMSEKLAEPVAVKRKKNHVYISFIDDLMTSEEIKGEANQLN